MQIYEKTIYENYHVDSQPLVYKSVYVDDIFCLFDNENDQKHLYAGFPAYVTQLFIRNITELEKVPEIINREINKYVSKTYNSNNSPLEEENKTNNYYKLPYKGITS